MKDDLNVYKKYNSRSTKLSMKNRNALQASNTCGCYSCLNKFDTNEIVQWTDNNQTAICPKCNIDSVLPQPTDLDLTHDNLKIIHDYWFGITN